MAIPLQHQISSNLKNIHSIVTALTFPITSPKIIQVCLEANGVEKCSRTHRSAK
jgi:hypothetical protein